MFIVIPILSTKYRLQKLIYHIGFVTFVAEAYGQEENSLQDENNKIRDAAGERMLSFWQKMNREGVEFFVDGENMRPSDAFAKAVKEDGVYMTDYVLGEAGEIQQIRLDKVNLE